MSASTAADESLRKQFQQLQSQQQQRLMLLKQKQQQKADTSSDDARKLESDRSEFGIDDDLEVISFNEDSYTKHFLHWDM